MQLKRNIIFNYVKDKLVSNYSVPPKDSNYIGDCIKLIKGTNELLNYLVFFCFVICVSKTILSIVNKLCTYNHILGFKHHFQNSKYYPLLIL